MGEGGRGKGEGEGYLVLAHPSAASISTEPPKHYQTHTCTMVNMGTTAQCDPALRESMIQSQKRVCVASLHEPAVHITETTSQIYARSLTHTHHHTPFTKPHIPTHSEVPHKRPFSLENRLFPSCAIYRSQMNVQRPSPLPSDLSY